jgi:hypothetical protein
MVNFGQKCVIDVSKKFGFKAQSKRMHLILNLEDFPATQSVETWKIPS